MREVQRNQRMLDLEVIFYFFIVCRKMKGKLSDSSKVLLSKVEFRYIDFEMA